MSLSLNTCFVVLLLLDFLSISSGQKLIDLTHPFDNGFTLSWPNSPKFNLSVRLKHLSRRQMLIKFKKYFQERLKRFGHFKILVLSNHRTLTIGGKYHCSAIFQLSNIGLGL